VGLQDLYTGFVQFVCRSPRRAAVYLLLACLPLLFLTVRFFGHVEAGLQELLPRDAPTVRALDQIHDRLGSQSHLTVVVESNDPPANRRFITELAEALRQRHIPELLSIQANVKVERSWLRRRAPLLLPAEKFDTIVGEVESAVAASKKDANPLFISLDDDQEKSTQRWAHVRQVVERETASYDRFQNGFLETSDGHTVVAVLWLSGSEVDMGPSTRLLSAVETEAARLKPQFPPELRVAFTGDVANLIEEHDAILADLSLSSVLVFVLVGLLIVGYFRSPRSVLVVLTGVVPGLLATFAAGRLIVGHLNSNTAFLGSIIAGNGINYPLLFLAYYRSQAPELSMRESIERAARQALPGTLGAAATASAAYAGLAFSNFRGFSQFGYLGGVGMLLTWGLTFLAVPVGIALYNPPRRPTRSGVRTGRWTRSLLTDGRWLKAGAVVFVTLALVLTGVGVARGFHEGIYEMHLKALRNRRSLATGSASWEDKLTQLFGTWLNPVVVLVKSPEDREAAATELRRVLQTGPVLAADRIETIENYRPALPEQERRLKRLHKLARTFRALDQEDVPEDARPLVEEWMDEDRLTTISYEEIPKVMLQGFRETSGVLDRSVLIFPALAVDYADGVNMLWLARRLSEARLPEGAVVGGAFLFMADVFRLVHQEAPRVVLVVCALVALVLVPIFWRRPGRIPLVIITVAPVAIAAQAIMLALGVKINMLNFAAVPITIGVGADYVINLVGAMDTLNLDARRACARMGLAILLCSLTTIVGYASLLVAQSGALRTFGWAAVLGEVMAVVTVLLVLPALLPRRKTPTLTSTTGKGGLTARRTSATIETSAPPPA
jgi:predicted RND superfamily exporter protein